jgi:hypothetical protein
MSSLKLVALGVWVMGVSSQRGLVGRGVTEEFYTKVLKSEIMNSRNLINYFSKEVPRTIEFVPPVTLSPGRYNNFPVIVSNMRPLANSLTENWP